MKTTKHDAEEAAALRRRAEAIAEDDEARAQEKLSPEAMQDALHELHVHQIELEMQNEELRRAREEIEASRALYFDLYYLAPVGYMTLNEANQVLQANLTVAHLLNQNRVTLIKQPFTRFILPEDQDIFYLHRKQLFATQPPDGAGSPSAMKTGGAHVCELRLLRQGNEPFWAQLEATLVLAADGSRVCRVMVIDVSKRKLAEEEALRLEALLRQQQRLQSVGTLAGGMAHEINNPLMGLLNYAQMLQDDLDKDSPLHQYAEEIVKAGSRITSIVRHLTNLGRDDADASAPVRVHVLVERTLELLRMTLRHDKIEIIREVPLDLPRIRCNSHQIQQALMNVLVNAREALNGKYPGSHPDKTITITAQMLEDRTLENEKGIEANVHRIRFTVEDRGPGVPQGIRDQVFDPFFTTKGRATYSGLGLSIAHSIVHAHGGEMSVESEEGRFTRVHMDLPVQP